MNQQVRRSPRLRGASEKPRIALLTHGLESGGGVPAVARWLRSNLLTHGRYAVDICDLATSRRDPASRRVSAARSWCRPSLLQEDAAPDHSHWGANAVELEFMRYRPRRELTRFLNRYDLIQVVAGTPAWANVAGEARPPTIIQVATTVARERESILTGRRSLAGTWDRAMTAMTTAIERRALRAANAVLVENREMLAHVRAHSGAPAFLAQPGVDIDRFRPGPEGWDPGRYLLSVCRLGEPRKGLIRMIQSYAVLRSLRPQAPKLILAGRGPVHASLYPTIARSGLLDSVHVMPDVSAEALPELYRGASVFLQTSYEEGLGLSLLEAMASGLPAVATATAGSRELVVDGETGWLVANGSDGDLPECFADRLGDVIDRSGRSFAASARRRSVEYFSSAATLHRFVAVYDDLLS
jgi:glycosyltransferase involved in cell wall biosynthesis